MIQRARAEFAIELFGSELAEVIDGVGPQMENIVSGECLPLLQQHHLSPQQGQFNGHSQATWTSTQHEALGERKSANPQHGRDNKTFLKQKVRTNENDFKLLLKDN